MSHNANSDCIRGCLLAGAIGDALGAAIEFASLAEIRARFGPQGLTDFAPVYGRLGAITDDTQLTLCTAEGLIRANVRLRSKGIAHLPSVIQYAYVRWLHTQGWPWSEPGRSFASGQAVPDGWLIGVPQLHQRRAPGTTCLSALGTFVAGAELGSPDHPPNDSKGCGALMRAAPIGLCGTDLATAFRRGCEIGALTHGHPSGYLPAGMLAATVCALVQGAALADALDSATAHLRGWPGASETVIALEAARRLSRTLRPTGEHLEQLGGGWTGEECLAIASCAALAATDFEDGLVLAVNHGGDSDSTGAVCGNLLGALYGAAKIPTRWLAELEMADVIGQLADDLSREFGTDPPHDAWGGAPPAWLERYPGS